MLHNRSHHAVAVAAVPGETSQIRPKRAPRRTPRAPSRTRTNSNAGLVSRTVKDLPGPPRRLRQHLGLPGPRTRRRTASLSGSTTASNRTPSEDVHAAAAGVSAREPWANTVADGLDNADGSFGPRSNRAMSAGEPVVVHISQACCPRSVPFARVHTQRHGVRSGGRFGPPDAAGRLAFGHLGESFRFCPSEPTARRGYREAAMRMTSSADSRPARGGPPRRLNAGFLDCDIPHNLRGAGVLRWGRPTVKRGSDND